MIKITMMIKPASRMEERTLGLPQVCEDGFDGAKPSI
jgi:hypothetical protein